MTGFESQLAGEFVEHVNLLQRPTEDVAHGRHVIDRLPRRAYRGSLPETGRSRTAGCEPAAGFQLQSLVSNAGCQKLIYKNLTGRFTRSGERCCAKRTMSTEFGTENLD